TYPLFGDAGTVTALQFEETAAPITYDLNSDGSGHKAIIIPDGGIRNLASPESFKLKEISKGIKRAGLNLALNGLDVFNFSVTEVPASLKEFLAKTEKQPDDFDSVILNQAN